MLHMLLMSHRLRSDRLLIVSDYLFMMGGFLDFCWFFFLLDEDRFLSGCVSFVGFRVAFMG